MNANERFEYMAELFHKQTGRLAPGKDRPDSFECDYDEYYTKKLWSDWVEGFYSELFSNLKGCNKSRA